MFLNNNITIKLMVTIIENKKDKNLKEIRRYEQIVSEEFFNFRRSLPAEREVHIDRRTEYLPSEGPTTYVTRTFVTENVLIPRRGLSRIFGEYRKSVKNLATLGHPVSNNTFTSEDGLEFNLDSEVSEEFLPYAKRIGESYGSLSFVIKAMR